MKTTIILLFMLVAGHIVNAQDNTLKNVAETQALSSKVVELFEQNKISKSFSEMEVYWPIPSNEVEAIEEKTIKYLNLIDERFGKTIGHSKVKNETIGDFAVRETYIIRYEFTAIRLIFTYYKNDKGWILNAFKWDDSFTDEFK